MFSEFLLLAAAPAEGVGNWSFLLFSLLFFSSDRDFLFWPRLNGLNRGNSIVQGRK